jgi:hypothetical protein
VPRLPKPSLNQVQIEPSSRPIWFALPANTSRSHPRKTPNNCRTAKKHVTKTPDSLINTGIPQTLSKSYPNLHSWQLTTPSKRNALS